MTCQVMPLLTLYCSSTALSTAWGPLRSLLQLSVWVVLPICKTNIILLKKKIQGNQLQMKVGNIKGGRSSQPLFFLKFVISEFITQLGLVGSMSGDSTNRTQKIFRKKKNVLKVYSLYLLYYPPNKTVYHPSARLIHCIYMFIHCIWAP